MSSNEKEIYSVLLPNSGDVDLFIKLSDQLNIPLENLTLPDLKNFDLKSADSFGADTALITGDLLKKCGDTCLFILGVYGAEDSDFTLTLS